MFKSLSTVTFGMYLYLLSAVCVLLVLCIITAVLFVSTIAVIRRPLGHRRVLGFFHRESCFETPKEYT